MFWGFFHAMLGQAIIFGVYIDIAGVKYLSQKCFQNICKLFCIPGCINYIGWVDKTSLQNIRHRLFF